MINEQVEYAKVSPKLAPSPKPSAKPKPSPKPKSSPKSGSASSSDAFHFNVKFHDAAESVLWSFASNSTMAALRDHFADELKVSSKDIKLRVGDNPITNFRTLVRTTLTPGCTVVVGTRGVGGARVSVKKSIAKKSTLSSEMKL